MYKELKKKGDRNQIIQLKIWPNNLNKHFSKENKWQIMKKMLKMISLEGNINQKWNELSSHPVRVALSGPFLLPVIF
jgi:hypothetical protein